MQELYKELATLYQVDSDEFIRNVKNTCFPGGASDPQLFMFLSIAHKYSLNPFANEIHAFVSKTGKLQVIVGVDGWLRIANRDSQFDGIEFNYREEGGKLIAVTCRVHRKDRRHPIEATEFMEECVQDTTPWKKWPRRMLTNKTMVQGFRRAFSLTEIVDPDEAERIVHATSTEAVTTPVAEQPKPLDYQERIPANFTVREGVKASERPHLRVKLDEVHAGVAPSVDASGLNSDPVGSTPTTSKDSAERHPSADKAAVGNAQHNESPPTPDAAAPPPAALGACQFKDCKLDAVERTETNFGTFNLCTEHASNYKGKPRARRKVFEAQTAAEGASVDNGKSMEAGKIADAAPSTVDAQRAAGLEKIDPNESSLETFIRIHEVPEKRINLFLAKKGVADRKELDTGGQAELLGILHKSYGEVMT